MTSVEKIPQKYLMTLTLIIVYSRWYNHSGWHYTYTIKSTNVRNMETNTFCHSFVQNIQVYKLKKNKTKDFYIVYIKYCLIMWDLSCTIYLITYVSISLVCRPKRNGNNKFRFFHCIEKKRKERSIRWKIKGVDFNIKWLRTLRNWTDIPIQNPTVALQRSVET